MLRNDSSGWVSNGTERARVGKKVSLDDWLCSLHLSSSLNAAAACQLEQVRPRRLDGKNRAITGLCRRRALGGPHGTRRVKGLSLLWVMVTESAQSATPMVGAQAVKV